ncbi:hypothetical protein GCM10009638_05800 [Luteococcus sanguinis]
MDASVSASLGALDEMKRSTPGCWFIASQSEASACSTGRSRSLGVRSLTGTFWQLDLSRLGQTVRREDPG